MTDYKAASASSLRRMLGAARRADRGRNRLRQSGLIWALILLVIVASLSSPAFFHAANLVNVLRETALIGLLGIGMTFVILTAGIDLSVGSIVSVVAVVTAGLLADGVPPALVIPISLAAGGLVGVINGLGIVRAGVPAFIMTLGVLVMGKGLALSFSDGRPVSLGDSADGISWLGRGELLGLATPVWIFAAVLVVAILVLRITPFGRYVYAIGDNREAARLAGINVGLVQLSVYVISGALAGLTGLIYTSRLTVGDPSFGDGLELNAIAIVVIGGTSLFGGEGGVSGTLVGAAIVAVLANMLNLLGVSPYTQQIIEGAVLVVAVLIDQLGRRRRRATRPVIVESATHGNGLPAGGPTAVQTTGSSQSTKETRT